MFKERYGCLSADEKADYFLRIRGENEVNPFVNDNLIKLRQVDKDTSELCNGAPPANLLESYRIVNETL